MQTEPTVKLCECGCGEPAPIATTTKGMKFLAIWYIVGWIGLTIALCWLWWEANQ